MDYIELQNLTRRGLLDIRWKRGTTVMKIRSNPGSLIYSNTHMKNQTSNHAS